MAFRQILTLVALLGTASAQAAVPSRTVSPVRAFSYGMLHVEQFGDAGKPAIIMIPALLCGSWQWNGQIPLLQSTHTVYALTLPGFDGIPFVQGGHLMERATQDLAGLIKSRHLSHPILVGHSLGGTLAVYFAEHEPGIAGAIFAAEGGYPIAPTQAERDRRIDASVRPFLNVPPAQFGSVLRRTMLRYVITSPRDVDAVETLAARSDPKAVVAWLRAALSLDLTPGLHTISAPFVEIVPFDAQIDPYQGFATFAAKRSAYTRWTARAPHGKTVMINHSRHFVMFDRPDKFNKALLDAIAADDQQHRNSD